MENASKALLIASGILFAMLVLTMMVYMSGRITEMGEAQESKKAAEQLAAYNAEYEAYNKKLMYGTDVITVINKAKEDGITIEVEGYTDLEALKVTLSANIKESTTTSDYAGLKIFECIDIRYDVTTGKVNYMKFKEKII